MGKGYFREMIKVIAYLFVRSSGLGKGYFREMIKVIAYLFVSRGMIKVCVFIR